MSRMRRLAALASARRGKWAVVVGWLVLVGLFAPVGEKVIHRLRYEPGPAHAPTVRIPSGA
jgi:hypothetical protein